jgi:hypothetical protein
VTITDVTNTQLAALTSATSYVSISVGGNDAGFADVLTECALAVTADVVAASSASGDEQAALQRQYAAADRRIEPEVFVAPDLTTPEARRAARKAGVDLDRFIARSQRAAG